MKAGASGANGAMSENLESLGHILQNSISITTEDGTTYELRESGGGLIDSLEGEPTLTVNATLIGIEKATPFWETETVEGKEQVKSLVNSGKYSVSFESEVVGSDTFEAPYTSIKATPVFSEEQGWTVVLAIKLLKGGADYLFAFGKVA